MTDDHDQLDPAEALMRAVGTQLREVRLERGEELDDIAQALRIKAIYLFGIEQGDLSMMPGRTYALGFLRSYADHLGFDGDDLIAQIKSSVANLTDKTRFRIRTPLPESRLPKTPILVLSLAALAGIYAGWSYLNRSGQLVIETVAEVPGNLRSMALDALGEEGQGSGPVLREAVPPAADPAAPPAADPAAPAAADPAAPAASPAPAGESGASPPPATGDREVAASPAAPPSAAVPAAAPPATAAREAAPGEAPLAAAPPATAPGDPPAAVTAPREVAGPPPPAPPPEAAPEPRLAAARPPETELAEPPLADAVSAQPAAGPAPAAGAADGAAEPAPPPIAELRERLERLQMELGAPVAAEPAAGAETLAARPVEAAGGESPGRIHEPENTDARVVLRALGSSWIRISSLGGDYLRTRTLQQGDVFLVPNRSDLELWTGNAGGIEVILDGTLLAPLGDDGAVLREVPLDPPSLSARFGEPVLR